jgi:3-polyprenyl-4-hydroxybenzoate decarboxylase
VVVSVAWVVAASMAVCVVSETPHAAIHVLQDRRKITLPVRPKPFVVSAIKLLVVISCDNGSLHRKSNYVFSQRTTVNAIVTNCCDWS